MTIIRNNVSINNINQLLEGKNLNNALVSMALFRINETTYGLRFLRIKFLKNGDLSKENKSEYEYFIFLHKLITSEDAIKLLEKLYSKQDFIFDNLKISALNQEQLFMGADVASNFNYGYALMEVPFIYLDTQINIKNPINPHNKSFIKTGLPYYPDIDAAIFHELELNGKISPPIQNKIEVIIPDYRARITEMIINNDNKKVTLNVDSPGIPEENITVKYYFQCTNKEVGYNKEDLKLNRGTAIISTNGEILYIDIIIILENNHVLDYRNFNYLSGNDYNGTVKVKGFINSIESLIKNGESQYIIAVPLFNFRSSLLYPTSLFVH